VEFPADDPIHSGMLTLCVITELRPKLIGTAFIVAATDRQATAISAARCFEQIRAFTNPRRAHEQSTLREFLAQDGEIALDSVKAIYKKDVEMFFVT